MAQYSKALKESVIQKMMPPNNVPVPQLVRETGISDVTLYSWRRKAVSQGVPVPGDGKNPDQWTPQNKLAVVIETAALNQSELSAYCRKKGLFAEQIHQWKEACVAGVSAKSDNQPAQRTNSERFRSQPPSQIVPTLADEGVYRLARQRNPERWGSRSIRNWSLAESRPG